MAKAKGTASTQKAGTAETTPIDKKAVADRFIRNCSLVSVGAGILPLPVVDVLALGGVQVYLVRELCKIYDVPFVKERVKTILAAVAGAAAPIVVAPAAVALAKFVPGVGSVIAAVAMPGLAAASTMAVGRIFRRHLAAGGTLDDVDVDAMKAEYEEEIKQTKQEAVAA